MAKLNFWREWGFGRRFSTAPYYTSLEQLPCQILLLNSYFKVLKHIGPIAGMPPYIILYFIGTIDDPGRKMKWQQIQGEIAQEYDVIKNIMQTLNLFKGGHYDSQVILIFHIYLVNYLA